MILSRFLSRRDIIIWYNAIKFYKSWNMEGFPWKKTVSVLLCAFTKNFLKDWIMYHNFMDARSRMNFAEWLKGNWSSSSAPMEPFQSATIISIYHNIDPACQKLQRGWCKIVSCCISLFSFWRACLVASTVPPHLSMPQKMPNFATHRFPIRSMKARSNIFDKPARPLRPRFPKRRRSFVWSAQRRYFPSGR